MKSTCSSYIEACSCKVHQKQYLDVPNFWGENWRKMRWLLGNSRWALGRKTLATERQRKFDSVFQPSVKLLLLFSMVSCF